MKRRGFKWRDVGTFLRALPADTRQSAIKLGVAMLWFRFHCDTGNDGMLPIQIADELESLHLFNKSRSMRVLNQIGMQDTVEMSSRDKGYLIRFETADRLDEALLSFTEALKDVRGTPVPPPEAEKEPLIDPISVKQGTPFGRTFNELLRQANLAYENQMYDACVLLCRRLSEVALYKAYDARGKISSIKGRDGQLKRFVDMNKVAKAERDIHFSRDTLSLLEKVRLAGNQGSHSMFDCVKRREVEEIRTHLRKGLLNLLDAGHIEYY